MTTALDAIDRRIVERLRNGGHLSNAELAERVGLSPSQCSRRRQRLEEAGIIRGYRATFDARQLGFDVTAFVQVTLAVHTEAARQKFHKFVGSQSEILSCHSITGQADYILRVLTETLVGLNALVLQILESAPGTRVQSLVVLESIKDRVDTT